jgi:hypothetical protein
MAFAIPSATSFALRRPVSPPAPYVRPLDWPTITDNTNEVQFLTSDGGIPAVALLTNFTRGATGDIIIDWGDGTTDTVTTTGDTTTNHTYATGGTGGTPSSRGYSTFVIRVYPDISGVRITRCQVVANTTIQQVGFVSNILEAYYGDTTVESFLNYFSGGNMNFTRLEHVKLPQVVVGTNALRTTFNGCSSLATVVLPTSASDITILDSTFNGCRNLQGPITIPSNSTSITSLLNTFSGCNALTEINLPPTLNSVTNISGCFLGCVNLTSLILPPLVSCTNYLDTFNSCSSLLSLEIKSFTTAAADIEFRRAFNQCSSLEQVIFPGQVTAGTRFSMRECFRLCPALVNFNFPSNVDIYSGSGGGQLDLCFELCDGLQSVTLPSSLPGLTSMVNTFVNCFNLQEITLPTTVGATINMQNTFSSCTVISTITIPSSYNITNLSATFFNCRSLNSLTLPNNAQNLCTTMASMVSGCSSLENLTLPTSLNLVNNLTETFFLCHRLKTVVLPATMNSVTTALRAFGCNNVRGSLIEVTLPTSMSECTTFQELFVDQYNLEKVVFPTNCPKVTNYIQCFVRAQGVKEIVLPTTFSPLAAGAMNRMFDGTTNLTILTNEEFLGSGVTGATGVAVDGTTFFNTTTLQVTELSLSTKLSKLSVAGSGTTDNTRSKLSSLRLTNTGSGQWGGGVPQIDVRFTSLSTAALNTLFADMAAQGSVVSKTINITSASGAAGLTAADRLVITSIGWTITG